MYAIHSHQKVVFLWTCLSGCTTFIIGLLVRLLVLAGLPASPAPWVAILLFPLIIYVTPIDLQLLNNIILPHKVAV